MAASRAGGKAIGDDAVKAKTGKLWTEWFRILDDWGATEVEHKAIASYLHEEHGLPGWWAQMVTVRYEQERGLRKVGEKTEGWQVSAQKTLPSTPEDLWTSLTRNDALRQWLGQADRLRLDEGSRYRLKDGTEGEIRAARPGQLLRFTWEHPQMKSKSTVELTLTPTSSGKTAVRFQHTRLASEAERTAMRDRWRTALGTLQTLL